MSKKPRFYPTFGYSSILFIFILLSLVTFSILSIVTAQSDYRLTEKNADRTLTFYETSNEAQLWVSSIDSTLQHIYQHTDSADDFYQECADFYKENTTFTMENGDYLLSNSFPLTNCQSLDVCLRITYPKQDTDTFYQIIEWKLITIDTIEDYNETFHLFGTDN